MLAVALAAIVVVACSAAVGQGVCALSGRPAWEWWSPAVGFAALLAICGVLIRVPGHAKTALVGVAIATAASLAFRSVRAALVSASPEGAPAALLTIALSLIPFLVLQRTGILGEGVNNDSGAHLGTAWWLEHQRGPVPVGALGGGLADVGYPVGPHGMMDVLALAKISLEHAFDGLLIAVAALTTLAALGAVRSARLGLRWVAALLVGLCYMAVSFQVQASYKETMEALLVIAAVLCARDVLREDSLVWWRAGIPLGVILGGTVYEYSYAGLAWAVTAIIAVALASGRLRSAAVAAPGVVLAAAIVIAPSINQIVRFVDSPFHSENGEGNLRHAVNALEGLGVWFGSDFRWNPDPTWLTAVGVAVALAAAVIAIARLVRAHDLALPAALVPVLGIYAYVAAEKDIYLGAKALVVAAPLVTLTVAAGLLLPQPRGLFVRVVAVLAAVAAAFSSFLVLRDAHVGPEAHRAELHALRTHIRDDGSLLFMPKNDLAQWDLIGLPMEQPRKLYAPVTARPRAARAVYTNGFYDFDNFTPATLDRFRYAITTNTPYQSRAPGNWHPIARTPSYILWRRAGATPERLATDFASTPGRVLDCASKLGRLRLGGARGGYAVVLPRPVTGLPLKWKGQPGDAGDSATMTLRVPRGRWDLSLAYAANTGLDVSAGGLRKRMPATTDRVGPYYSVGTLDQRRAGPVTIRVKARDLGWFGRLIGAHGHTRGLDTPLNVPLGGVALTRHGQSARRVAPGAACGRYVDHFVPGT